MLINDLHLYETGVVSDEEILNRWTLPDMECLFHKTLTGSSRKQLFDLFIQGEPASFGVVSGRIFFQIDHAVSFLEKIRFNESKNDKASQAIILAIQELTLSDLAHFNDLSGLIVKGGGSASHGAAIARARGIPCIVGLQDFEMGPMCKTAKIHGKSISAGEWITLDSSGFGAKIYLGKTETKNQFLIEIIQKKLIKKISFFFKKLEKKYSIYLKVRLNINHPKEITLGKYLGADGVGLCRTENFFLNSKTLKKVKTVLFKGKNSNNARSDLTTQLNSDFLEEIHFHYFKQIFELMDGKTASIRLMDLDFSGFIPLSNPGIGIRGCRYGIVWSTVYDLQVRSLFRAAVEFEKKTGKRANFSILIPFITNENELNELKFRFSEIQKQLKISSTNFFYKIGCMIENPASVFDIDKLAKIADFFVFGTNDLTQTALGISRDDSSSFVPFYLKNGFLDFDPFQKLSCSVKSLIEIAISSIKKQEKSEIFFGICGEQIGDLDSLEFYLKKNINYISCSPFRVLPTRLGILKAAIKQRFISGPTHTECVGFT